MNLSKRLANKAQSAFSIAKPRGLGSSYGFIDRRPFPFPCRQISDLTEANGKRGVDTLAMVKSVEAQGVPSKQAEAITSAITKAFDDCLENVKENQSHLVVEAVRELRDEIRNLDRNISETRTGQRDEHAQEIHQLEQDLMKIPRDLRRDFNELKADFEATKYLGVKFAIFTLGTAGAVGLGTFCIMW